MLTVALGMRFLTTAVTTGGEITTAAIPMMLVWSAVPVSGFIAYYQFLIDIASWYYTPTLYIDELFPAVANVTVTDIGPTSFTVQWNVSIASTRDYIAT